MEPAKSKELNILVPLERLQQEARKRQLTLCPRCAEHYEPCLAVTLYQEYHTETAHIMPVVYTNASPWEDKWLHYFYTACEDFYCLENRSKRHYGIKGLICLSPLYDHSSFRTFLCHILRRYPALLDRPITERALREAGCDLEAEWAMWQLAKGGDEEQ
jgi:hypothetical protein